MESDLGCMGIKSLVSENQLLEWTSNSSVHKESAVSLLLLLSELIKLMSGVMGDSVPKIWGYHCPFGL